MKSLPFFRTTSAGVLASSVLRNFQLGQRASNLLRQDTSFASDMAMSKTVRRPSRRIAGRRYRARVSYRRPRLDLSWRRVVRCGGIFETPLTAGTFVGTTHNFSLNDVQTSDLVSAYRLFRLRKVVVYIVPRVDPGNSGVTNNFHACVSTACDPEGIPSAPTSNQQVTAYDNSRSKFVTSGDVYKYTFYPKCVNTVDNSGTATAAGSYGMNPWLQLNATGIAIPHRQLLIGYTVSNSTTVTFSRYFEYHFDVKGMA